MTLLLLPGRTVTEAEATAGAAADAAEVAAADAAEAMKRQALTAYGREQQELLSRRLSLWRDIAFVRTPRLA